MQLLQVSSSLFQFSGLLTANRNLSIGSGLAQGMWGYHQLGGERREPFCHFL